MQGRALPPDAGTDVRPPLPLPQTPDVHIFTRSKLPWIRLPEDVPSFEVYYKTRELWHAESLERLDAVTG